MRRRGDPLGRPSLSLCDLLDMMHPEVIRRGSFLGNSAFHDPARSFSIGPLQGEAHRQQADHGDEGRLGILIDINAQDPRHGQASEQGEPDEPPPGAGVGDDLHTNLQSIDN